VQPSRIAKALETAKDAGASLSIIDTAPHSADAAIIAAEAADLVLVPCRPGILDLHAIGSTAWIVKLAGKPAFVILNAPRPVLLQKPGGGQCFGSSPLVAEAKFLPDPGDTNLSVRAFKGLLPTQWRPLSAVGGVLLHPLMVAADNVASSASVAVLASWPSSWRFFGRMIAKAISASAIHCSRRQTRWRDRPR
jgi:hypothetical protein